MDPITIAISLLGAAGEVSKLAAQSIEASRAGDDAKALALLDQALEHQKANAAAALVELDAIKARIAQAIEDKFGKDPA
jgi:hypothetical protein